MKKRTSKRRWKARARRGDAIAREVIENYRLGKQSNWREHENPNMYSFYWVEAQS
jgi:hypothetical protein